MLRKAYLTNQIKFAQKLPRCLESIPHKIDLQDANRFSHQIRSDQSLSCVRLFETPWMAVRQASLSITNSRSSLRLMSIESVMASSHLILCHPLLLLPPIPPSIRVFSNESTLRMRWPKYWSFSFSIIPSKEIQGWSPTEWSRAKTNRVLPRKCTGHNKHPLPTTQEKTLYMDITR